MNRARWIGFLGLATALAACCWSIRIAGSQEVAAPTQQADKGKEAAVLDQEAEKASEPADKLSEKKDEQLAVETAVIDLLIEILRDPASGAYKRRQACSALAKRGARKALPVMVDFLSEHLRVPTEGDVGKRMEEQMNAVRWIILPAIESLGGDREHVGYLLYCALRSNNMLRSQQIICLAPIASRCGRDMRIMTQAMFQVIAETENEPAAAARQALVIMGQNCLGELQLGEAEQFVKVPWPVKSVETEASLGGINIRGEPGYPVIYSPDLEAGQKDGSVFVKRNRWVQPGIYYIIVTGDEGKSGFIKVKAP